MHIVHSLLLFHLEVVLQIDQLVLHLSLKLVSFDDQLLVFLQSLRVNSRRRPLTLLFYNPL